MFVFANLQYSESFFNYVLSYFRLPFRFIQKKLTIHILWLNGKSFAKINQASNSMFEGLHVNQYKLFGFYVHLIFDVTTYFIVTDIDFELLEHQK